MPYFFSTERANYNKIFEILLNELPLPFVNDLKHLGNVLQSDNSMTIDCNKNELFSFQKCIPLTKNFILRIQMFF